MHWPVGWRLFRFLFLWLFCSATHYAGFSLRATVDDDSLKVDMFSSAVVRVFRVLWVMECQIGDGDVGMSCKYVFLAFPVTMFGAWGRREREIMS